MNRKKMHNYVSLNAALSPYGFTLDEVDALLSIERTLGRWAERECNGEIERADGTGKPYAVYGMARNRYPILDRERGALRRLKRICDAASSPGLLRQLVADHTAALRVCRDLVDAIDAGENNAGSVDWEDIEEVYNAAKKIIK